MRVILISKLGSLGCKKIERCSINRRWTLSMEGRYPESVAAFNSVAALTVFERRSIFDQALIFERSYKSYQRNI